MSLDLVEWIQRAGWALREIALAVFGPDPQAPWGATEERLQRVRDALRFIGYSPNEEP